MSLPPSPLADPAQGAIAAARGLRMVAVAQIVARNIVPLAGVLFLGWRADSVLLLYFLDTMLAIGIMVAGLIFAMPRWAPEVRPIGPFRAIAATLFLCVFLALPLGVPLVILLAANDTAWRELLADPGLRTGAIMQTAAAVWSYIDFARALRDHSPEDLRVKRRFALVFLRWVGVLMVIFSDIGVMLPVLVIGAYVAISIWEEIAPDAFLLATGDREDVDPAQRHDPMPGPAPRPPGLPRKSKHRRL